MLMAPALRLLASTLTSMPNLHCVSAVWLASIPAGTLTSAPSLTLLVWEVPRELLVRKSEGERGRERKEDKEREKEEERDKKLKEKFEERKCYQESRENI